MPGRSWSVPRQSSIVWASTPEVALATVVVIGSDIIEPVESADLIRRARGDAGLSQRQLAEAAGTSAAAICLYERAERVPRVDTLARILGAADVELLLDSRSCRRVDERQNGRDLWEVLELADQLPQRHADQLLAPRFAALAVGVGQ